MRFIPTYIHGVVDYIGGLALLGAPEIFGFSGVGGPAEWVPRTLGVIVLLQALFTNYELGIVRTLSMRTHLINDYLASIFLAASPWLFGFNDLPSEIWMPHVIVGLAILGIALLTEQTPRHAAAVSGHANRNVQDDDRRTEPNRGNQR